MQNDALRDERIVEDEEIWNLVERETLVQHKGKTILVDDFSRFHGEEATRIIRLHAEAAIARDKYNLLNLIDVTGSYADREVLATLKEVARDTAKYYDKVAVIGVEGVLKFFLHLINKFSDMGARPFDTKEEALDWLVE